MNIIEIDTSADDAFQTTLDQQNVTLRIRWQDFAASWFLSVFDDRSPGRIYCLNKRLMPYVVLAGAGHPDSFKGGFVAYASVDSWANLTRDCFEKNHRLYYVSQAELGTLNEAFNVYPII